MGQTTLLWWWLYNQDAFEALKALLYSEGPGAELFEDAQGRCVFHARNHKLTATRSNTSQATYRDQGTEPLFSRPWTYDPGTKDIANVVTTTIVQRTPATLPITKVWNYGQTLTLAPGQAVTVQATSSVPFTAAHALVIGTDLSAPGAAISIGAPTPASGQVASITFTNIGTSPCTLDSAAADGTGPQMRAQLVPVTATNVIANTLDTSVSQAAYGQQPYTLPFLQDISPATAQDLVNGTAAIYQNPRPQATVTLLNANWTREVEGFTREIADRVTLVEAQSKTNSDFWIERIQHSVVHGGAGHAVSFGTEAVWGAGFFILDSSLLDVGVLAF